MDIGISIVKINGGSQFVLYFNGKFLCGPYFINDKEVILNAVKSALKIVANKN